MKKIILFLILLNSLLFIQAQQTAIIDEAKIYSYDFYPSEESKDRAIWIFSQDAMIVRVIDKPQDLVEEVLVDPKKGIVRVFQDNNTPPVDVQIPNTILSRLKLTEPAPFALEINEKGYGYRVIDPKMKLLFKNDESLCDFSFDVLTNLSRNGKLVLSNHTENLLVYDLNKKTYFTKKIIYKEKLRPIQDLYWIDDRTVHAVAFTGRRARRDDYHIDLETGKVIYHTFTILRKDQ